MLQAFLKPACPYLASRHAEDDTRLERLLSLKTHREKVCDDILNTFWSKINAAELRLGRTFRMDQILEGSMWSFTTTLLSSFLRLLC
jgi:hypothetical protein